MAKILQIKVSMSARINVGNFEGIEPHFELLVELAPGEDPIEAEKAVLATVQEGWDENARAMLAEVKARRIAIGGKDLEVVDELRKYFASK